LREIVHRVIHIGMALSIASLLLYLLVLVVGVIEIRHMRVDLGKIANRPQTIPPLPAHQKVAENTEAIAALYNEQRRLTAAVSEGIAQVVRHDRRIEKAVAGARRLLKANGLEHPGLEAEAGEIREGDEEGSPEPELPPVQEEMVLDRPTGIPGVSAARLQQIREIAHA